MGLRKTITQNPFVPFLSQLCTDDGSFIKTNDIKAKTIMMVIHIDVVFSFLDIKAITFKAVKPINFS